MKTLVISQFSPETAVGGIERYLDNFLRFCQDNPFETIFLLPSTNGKKNYEKRGNTIIYRKDFLSFPSHGIFSGKGKKDTENIIEKKSKELLDFLLIFLEKEKIDLVNSQGFEAMPPCLNFALHMACYSRKIPCVMQVHFFPHEEIHKAMINSLPWRKLFCVSKSVTGDLLNKGVDVNKLETSYLGVDTKIFNQEQNKVWLKSVMKLPKSSKVILHASRITDGQKPILKAKGIIILLDSISNLLSRYPDLRLVIAVASPPKDLENEFNFALQELYGYIKINNLDGKVSYKVFKLDEMPKVYAGADLFVMASESETLGQVYIEAMACGTPVIGTNVGGVPEIITDNYNGFLVSPNDASALSQGIEELLVNHGLREKFIQSGLVTVKEKFSADKQFRSLYGYLEELVENNHKSR